MINRNLQIYFSILIEILKIGYLLLVIYSSHNSFMSIINNMNNNSKKVHYRKSLNNR